MQGFPHLGRLWHCVYTHLNTPDQETAKTQDCFLWNKLSFSHDYKSGGEQVLSHLPLSSLVHFRLIYWEILSGSSSTEPNHETPIYHLCLDAEKHKTNKISVSAFRSFSFYCLKWNVSFGSVTDHWILTSHSRFVLYSSWLPDGRKIE